MVCCRQPSTKESRVETFYSRLCCEIKLKKTLLIQAFLFFFFSRHWMWQYACREEKPAQTTKCTRNVSAHTNAYVPAAALYCLFPDTPHHLAQIKISLTQRGKERRSARTGNGDTVRPTKQKKKLWYFRLDVWKFLFSTVKPKWVPAVAVPAALTFLMSFSLFTSFH